MMQISFYQNFWNRVSASCYTFWIIFIYLVGKKCTIQIHDGYIYRICIKISTLFFCRFWFVFMIWIIIAFTSTHVNIPMFLNIRYFSDTKLKYGQLKNKTFYQSIITLKKWCTSFWINLYQASILNISNKLVWNIKVPGASYHLTLFANSHLFYLERANDK